VIRKSGVVIVGTALAATLGLAAWTGASPETWAGVSLLTTGGVLIFATVGAVCRGSHERPQFVGFAVFGWSYFALARWYSYHQGSMPTVCWLPGAGDIHNDILALTPDVRIAHDAWALAFAVLGSILAGLLVKNRVYPPRELDKDVMTIDRANIRAEEALRLCLGQIGMTYRVQSGYIRIVSDAYEPIPFEEDLVMIAGHSLLAICAAGFGGISALLVARILGRHNER
jgi:hypothetical protein